MKRLCCLCLVLVQWIGMMNLQDVFAWETIGDAATLLLGKENVLTNLYTPDQGVLVERGGRYGRQLKIDGSNSKYFWIDINDDFAYDIPEYSPMKLTVEYFDEGQGGFEIDYDTHKPYWKHNMWPQFPGGEMNEIWGTVGCVQMENTKQWQTKTYYIEDMRLANRIEGGRDLRIGLWGPILGGHSAEDVVFGSITLEKVDWEKPVQVNPCSSEKIGNIFHPDEPIALYLNYQNKGSQKLNTKIEISVSDSNHTVFWTETKAQVFEAREVKSISVVPQDIPDRYDIFVGDVTITSYFENKPEHVYVQKHQFEFSKSMRVEKKNPRMGTNQQINALRRGTIDDIPHLMSDLGITGNRDGIYWRYIEKEKNVLIMPEGDEARIRGQVENGSEVLMFFTDGIPLWNGGNRHAAPNTDEGIAAFGRYCGFVAQKLGDVIDYYEIWNEWNIDVFNISMEPPEVYVKLLKAAYTEIKKADPDSVVIGIDTAEIPLDMIRQMMDLGAYDYMDAYSTHPYDWSGTFQIDRFVENVTALKELMREYGPEKPHYITEMGFSNFLSQDPNVRGGFSREEQAYNSVKMHLWNYAYDLSDCLYQYSFLDQLDPYNREHNWGLTRGYAHAETPFGAKPSYLAIAAYNAFAGAYEYIDQTEVDGEYHSFRFYNEHLDKDVLIFCSEDEEKQITYELGTNEVELYDLYGNKMCDLYSENGKYTFSINPVPFYVVGDISTCNPIEKTEEDSTCEAPIKVTEVELSMYNGGAENLYYQKEIGFRLTFRNTENKKQTYAISYRVENEQGDLVDQGVLTESVLAKTKKAKEYLVTVEDYGQYFLTVTIVRGTEGTVRKTEFFYGKLNRTVNNELGVDIQTIPKGENTLSLVSQSGLGIVRDALSWEDADKGDGTYFIPDSMNQRITNANAQEMKVQLVLGGSHKNCQDGSLPQTPAELEEFKEYCKTVATRLKGKIWAYEIWASPNHGKFTNGHETTGTQYAAVLKAAWEGIREVDTQTAILCGSLRETSQNAIETYLQDLLYAEGGKYMDGLAVSLEHNSGNPHEQQNWVQNLQAIQSIVDSDENAKGLSFYLIIEGDFVKEEGDCFSQMLTILKNIDRIKVMTFTNPVYPSISFYNQKLGEIAKPEKIEEGIYVYRREDGGSVFALWGKEGEQKTFTIDKTADSTRCEGTTIYCPTDYTVEVYDRNGNILSASSVCVGEEMVYVSCMPTSQVSVSITNGFVTVKGTAFEAGTPITILAQELGFYKKETVYLNQLFVGATGDYQYVFPVDPMKITAITVYDGVEKFTQSMNQIGALNVSFYHEGLPIFSSKDVTSGEIKVEMETNSVEDLIVFAVVYGDDNCMAAVDTAKMNEDEKATIIVNKKAGMELQFLVWDTNMIPKIQPIIFN